MRRTAWLAIFPAAQASAQTAVFIHPSGPWRMRAADDPRFAAPDFGDGHGKTLALPHPFRLQPDPQLMWRGAISESNDITVVTARRSA